MRNELDRLTTLELLDRHRLGHLVDDKGQDSNHRKKADVRVCGGRAVVVARAQRRSSRCLHVMHSVARGNAIKRFLPIGSPQISHWP